MATAKREGLARRPARDEIELPFKLAEREIANVTFARQGPLAHSSVASLSIFANRVAAPAIPFDNVERLEASARDAKPKSARTRE